MIAVVHLWSVIEEECRESWATIAIGWPLGEGARLWCMVAFYSFAAPLFFTIDVTQKSSGGGERCRINKEFLGVLLDFEEWAAVRELLSSPFSITFFI